MTYLQFLWQQTGLCPAAIYTLIVGLAVIAVRSVWDKGE